MGLLRVAIYFWVCTVWVCYVAVDFGWRRVAVITGYCLCLGFFGVCLAVL